MSKKILRLSILLIVSSIFLSACTLPWKKKAVSLNPDGTPVNEQAVNSSDVVYTKQLKKFLNDNDLKTFLQNHSNSSNFSSSNSIAFASSSPFLNYRADSSGISAPDIFKTNGDYLYSLVRNELLIIKSRPSAETKIVSRISFKSRPANILVSGNSIVVYGADTEINSETVYRSFRRQNNYTFLKVYDVSDPISPKLVRDLKFEGDYSGARLVGDYIYFLTNTPGSYFDGEPLLPRFFSNNELVSPVCEASDSYCTALETYYFDVAYNSFNFSNISAVNIRDNNESVIQQAYLLNDNQDIYISPNNIYITYYNSIDEYGLEQVSKREIALSKLSPEEQNKITAIDSAPDYILNLNEKKLKVGVLIDNYINSLSDEEKSLVQTTINESVSQKIASKSNEASKTSIYRFSMNNKIAYEAIGEVNGRIIDRYSMDENGEFFRIATSLKQNTSVDGVSSVEYFSNVYILDKDLKAAGSLENLATAAPVSSARFMGNRAYLSTINAEDPLYVIGLSDSTKPEVLGAVKVTGNYSYLLPLDNNGNQLVSFGKETGNNNTVVGEIPAKGLKLSLFDFTNLQEPKELSSYIIGDDSSDSIALSDPLTFSQIYSNTKNYFVIPVSLKDKGNLSFAGSFIFALVDNRLTLKGRVDHSFGGHFTNSDFLNGFNYYDNTVKRSFHSNDAEDVIFSFSNKLLKVNKLVDLSLVKDLILTTGDDDYIITQPAGVSNPSSNSSNPSSGVPGFNVGDPLNPNNSGAVVPNYNPVMTPPMYSGTSTPSQNQTTESNSPLMTTPTPAPPLTTTPTPTPSSTSTPPQAPPNI